MKDFLYNAIFVGDDPAHVVVMFMILLVLLVSVVVIIERTFRYWIQYDLPNSAGFMAVVQKMVMNNSIENAMHHAQLAAFPKVTRMLPILATTANVATLLGLMGTLFGLMKSFGAAANASGAQKSIILAQGIAHALQATTFGLGTALVCLFTYGIIMMKQTAILDDINQNAARLTDLLYTRKMKIRGGSDGSIASTED